MIKTVCTSDAAPLDELLGGNIFVRAVTHYYVGKFTAYDEDWIILDEAAWVADTGRWSNALKTGQLNEVEPYPGRCLISRGAIVDISPWDHNTLTVVK